MPQPTTSVPTSVWTFPAFADTLVLYQQTGHNAGQTEKTKKAHMNTLFNNISWLRYAEWLAIAIIIYYIIVGFRCYSAEISNLFRRGSFKPAALDKTNPFLAIGTDNEAGPETRNTASISQHLEGADAASLEAETLIAALRAQIAEFSEQPYQPSAVPPKLKATIRKYQNLKNSPHRAIINKMIVAECEKTGIALLTEEEVDQWWSD
jgi:hypothetical protein